MIPFPKHFRPKHHHMEFLINMPITWSSKAYSHSIMTRNNVISEIVTLTKIFNT